MKPVLPLVESVEMRHARTVSGRTPIHRERAGSNTLLSGTTNRLSACTLMCTSRGAIAMGSNIGSVSFAPVFGRSPSVTPRGSSVGSSTGPGSRM